MPIRRRHRLFGDDDNGVPVIRQGEIFNSDDVEEFRVKLPEPPRPAPEPEDGGTEPWGDGKDSERHQLYLRFIRGRGEEQS
jgi:hypothetical protein